ncbi:hypothetical protein FH608_021865 [Nonomuraea phyllanthi]|uniref:DUF6879 domain-containing protein n=1 Tax=Nonomuraea phyllanthi TaxID=2219224 RepID=A0A5C4WC04_9ACTN|nr:DUF6879 family protein [Nonomuraea phyllanthi]KAB8192992.1 hypothetical protein FH608_021865 [Nonomuraea phyllanthi]
MNRLSFPPRPDLVATRLLPGDFRRKFREASRGVTGRVYKLERRQTFQEPGNPSWEAFAAGDMKRALELIEEDRAAQRDFRRIFDDRAAAFYRLRVIEDPLSRYLRWELAHFRLNAEEGEKIYIVNQAMIADLDLRYDLADYTIFDRSLAFFLNYSDDGLFLHADMVSDPAALAELVDISEEILARSIPFEDYPIDLSFPG